MAENQGITDTFFTKLKEQSFTIILLVGILWYQNNNYRNSIGDYKTQLDKKDETIMKLVDDERQRMVERNEYLMTQRDKYVDELINKQK
jgi:hypothetical protein